MDSKDEFEKRTARFGNKEQQRLRVLKKRLEHLLKRIKLSDKDLSYDRSEAGALTWALDRIMNSLGTGETWSPESKPTAEQLAQ